MALLLLAFLACSNVIGQNRQQAVVGRIEAKLLEVEKEQGFSGVVLVSKGDKVIFHNSYGWAGPEMDRRVSLDRRFMIASVSKAFVAASILQLEERGKLSTEDLIGKHLPGYPDWAGLNITIHQLLSHTSGIPDYINDRRIWFKFKQLAGWTPDENELINAFKDRPLLFHPGERFKYSNSGYVLLAKIVENASGMEFGEYLYQNILGPLKMENTGVGDFDMVGNRAVAYNTVGGKLRPIANFKSEWIYGMGEMYSTAADLRKWLHSYSDTLVLSKASKEKMMTPVLGGYGYGWHVYEQHEHRLISHGGYLPGWNSYVYYFPDDSLSVIAVSNSERANPIELCNEISRVVFLNEVKAGPVAIEDPYTGRYEIVESGAHAVTTPFDGEIVTVNEDEGSLQVRTPRGKTLRLTRESGGDWSEPREDIRVRFEDKGEGLMLTVLKDGQEWHWRKLSGDYQPAILR